MRLVIDIQGALADSRHRGIGRHSFSLSLAIAKLATQHEVWIIFNTALTDNHQELRSAFAPFVPTSRMLNFAIPEPVAAVSAQSAWRTEAAEILREQFILQLQPDVVLITSLFEGYGDNAVASVKSLQPSPLVAVILYDLIPYILPEQYLKDARYKTFYLRKLEQLKQADCLLSISEYSKTEMNQVFNYPLEKIAVAPCAVDECFVPLEYSAQRQQQLRRHYDISREIILCAPGGFDSRKNLRQLMLAYAQLSPAIRATHQLVIASRLSAVPTDDSRQELHQWRQEAGLGLDELVLTDYVPQDDLVTLYGMAKLFVFPSIHEGFGLPPLEAMACGAPVIGSNLTSIPEVVGHPDALFDPHNVNSISNKISQALEQLDFLNQLKEHGQKHIQHFNWDESAKKALFTLETLVAQNPDRLASTLKNNSALDAGIQALANFADKHQLNNAELTEISHALAYNQIQANAPQLLIDITQLVFSDAKSGIQRVVRSILLQLYQFNLPQTITPIYFEKGEFREARAFLKRFQNPQAYSHTPNLQYQIELAIDKTTDPIAQVHQGDIYFALDLNHIFSASLKAKLQTWKRRGTQLNFVIYDLLLQQHPEWGVKKLGEQLNVWLENVIQVADKMICISDSVALEVKDWIVKHPPQRTGLPAVSSFHLGADLQASQPSTGLPANSSDVLNHLKQRTSFISVATIEPRKGHKQMLAAAEILWAQNININLVFVGKLGWKMKDFEKTLLQHPELNKRLIWARGVSDEYLDLLYAHSHCLLAASEGEGFGLPLIEAAQHQIPILARNLAVFNEVAGKHAMYFDGLDAQSLATAMQEWLELAKLNQHPSSQGMPFLNWQQSAEQLLKALELPATRL